MATRKRKKGKDGRLHIRIDADLKEAMNDYAARRSTYLGAVVEAHFRALLEAEKSSSLPEAEQI